MSPLHDSAVSLPLRLLGRVFLPFACGYYVSYFFRTVNAVISPDLVRDVGLDANQLGLLTSAYFVAFALAQLPLGVLLDRFGPRRINAALLTVAAAGALVFSASSSLAGLAVGRALIGFGVSGCLMSSIKAFTLWFPMNRLATLNGALLAAGGLGALSASVPVEALLAHTTWRGVFDGLAALTLFVAVLVFLVVPERAESATPEPLRQAVAGVIGIYRDGGFWRIAGTITAVQGTFMALQGLWAAPWLRDVAGFDRAAVAEVLLAMAIATTLGFAASGAIADHLARRGIAPLTVLKAGATLNSLLTLMLALGVKTAAVPVWIALALVAPASALAHALLTHRFGRALAGRANTAANLLVFVGAFSAQWGIGAIVNLWPAVDGRYPAVAYGAGFGTFVALQLVALAALLPWRETPRP
jgi:predicted MFS family arabinose efflux permease